MYEVIKEFTTVRDKTVHSARMTRNDRTYKVALSSSKDGRVVNLDIYIAEGFYDALTTFNRKAREYGVYKDV